MILYIKALSGNTITVEPSWDDYIGTVKELISEKTGLTVRQQVLLFGGRPLPNDTTLSHWNIRDECTLHLLTRLRSSSKYACLPIRF